MANRLPAPPADYDQAVTLTRTFNLQYPGDALTVTAPSAASATGYEVRRMEATGGATLVASGTFTGSGMSLGTAGSGAYAKYGHYTLKLVGPDRGDGQYATDYGTCRFVIAENVATIPQSPFTPGTTAGGYSYGLHSPLAHGVFSLGTFRASLTLASQPDPPAASISGTKTSIDNYWNYWGQYADGVRARRITIQTLQNNSATDVQDNASKITQSVAALNSYRPGFVAGYTGRNEPSPQVFNLAEAQALGNAVRAGDPSAKAFGPDLVSLGFQGLGAPGLFNLLDAGVLNPGVALDGISYHEYNMVRDLGSQALPIYRNLKAGLAARGVDTTKMWMTEGGNETTWASNQAPTGQGNVLLRNLGLVYMTGTLVRELILGIPYEQAFHYYDRRGGFDQVPQWQMSVSGPYAGWAMHRAFAREVTQMLVVGEYDMGGAQDLYLAGHWQNPGTGDGVAAFMGNGPGLPALTCNVSGASTLTAVDCWGNTSTLTVSGGTVTVPVYDVPSYVRIPSGVTFTPQAQTWGSNLLTTGLTYADSGEAASNTQLAKLADGSRVTSYAYSSSSVTTTGNGYRTTSATFPRTLDVLSSGSITANKVVVVCPMPWQGQSALMDFDVQVKVAGSWVTTATYTQTTQSVKNFDYQSDTRVDVFSEAQRTFVVDLGATLTITGVRLNVRAGSFGMYLDPTMKLNPGTTTSDPNVITAMQVQSIEAYNATAPAPPVSSGPYVVRNIT